MIALINLAGSLVFLSVDGQQHLVFLTECYDGRGSHFFRITTENALVSAWAGREAEFLAALRKDAVSTNPRYEWLRDAGAIFWRHRPYDHSGVILSPSGR